MREHARRQNRDWLRQRQKPFAVVQPASGCDRSAEAYCTSTAASQAYMSGSGAMEEASPSFVEGPVRTQLACRCVDSAGKLGMFFWALAGKGGERS